MILARFGKLGLVAPMTLQDGGSRVNLCHFRLHRGLHQRCQVAENWQSPIGEIPLFPGTEMAAPARASPSEPAAVSAAEVRAWAKKNGLDVAARGRLRPEIWDQYRVAHLA
jgi:hypothetical protein